MLDRVGDLPTDRARDRSEQGVGVQKLLAKHTVNLDHHAFNFSNQILDEFHQSRSVLPSGSSGVAYRYVHYHSENWVAHIRRRTVQGERRDLCAILHFTSVDERSYRLPQGEVTNSLKAQISKLEHGHLEQSMLVHVIEVMEEGQQRGELWVPTIVQLSPLDCCPHRIAERSDTPAIFSKPIRCVTDGKHQVPSIGRRFLPRLVDSNGINELVESCPQVMETVSSNQPPSLQGGRPQVPNDDTVPGHFSVTLIGETNCLSLFPGADLILDGLHVFSRPREFETAPPKWRI